MPIYEHVYRPRVNRASSSRPVWLVIAITGIRLCWKKNMIVLLVIAAVPFFFRAVQIYLARSLDSGLDLIDASSLIGSGPGLYFDFLKGQMFLLMLAVILAGSGIIADDRRHKALSLYFSKPVNFRDYVAGKFMVPCFYGALVTLVPGLLLFMIELMISRNLGMLRSGLLIPFSITAFSLLAVIVMSALVIAFSAAAKGPRSAAVFFFTLMTFPDVIRRILGHIEGIGLISISADLRQVGSVLFFTERPLSFSPAAAFLVLMALTAASLAVLRRRVRPVEVVR